MYAIITGPSIKLNAADIVAPKTPIAAPAPAATLAKPVSPVTEAPNSAGTVPSVRAKPMMDDIIPPAIALEKRVDITVAEPKPTLKPSTVLVATNMLRENSPALAAATTIPPRKALVVSISALVAFCLASSAAIFALNSNSCAKNTFFFWIDIQASFAIA